MNEIATIPDFLNEIATLSNDKIKDIKWLFRGQSKDQTLLPSICRANPKMNSTDVEKQMLDELKRRSNLLIHEKLDSDWDWLIYAQHFGMATRLLDWTSNPLTAVWFAINNRFQSTEDSYVYALKVDETLSLTADDFKSGPFKIKNTKILRPNLNNNRVLAQQGYFTCHKFSTDAQAFVPLGKQPKYGEIKKYVVKAARKSEFLKALDIYGINFQSQFPDITGLCSQINWEFLQK